MQDNIFNRLTIEIKRAYYTYERYNSIATFALLYHEQELTPADLGKHVRISDKFLQVDKNHYFINFSFTEQTEAFKASQNIVLSLDNHFNDRSSRIALDTFDISNSPRIVINRLEQILVEIKKNPDSRVEDENVLNDLI